MCEGEEEGKQELSEGHQRQLLVPAHEEQLVLGQGTLHSVVVTVRRDGMGRVLMTGVRLVVRRGGVK